METTVRQQRLLPFAQKFFISAIGQNSKLPTKKAAVLAVSFETNEETKQTTVQLSSAGHSIVNGNFVSEFLSKVDWKNGKTICVDFSLEPSKKSSIFSHEQDFSKVFFVGLQKSPKDPKVEIESQYSDVELELKHKHIFSIQESVEKAFSKIKEEINLKKEHVELVVDDFGEKSARIVGEWFTLQNWSFKYGDVDQYTEEEKNELANGFIQFTPLNSSSSKDFQSGVIYSESQNITRTASEIPANLMTPTIFAETFANLFQSEDLYLSKQQLDKLKVFIYGKDWAKEKGMNSYLAVAQGSDEEPKVLEVEYRGNPNSKESIDLFLVGKGITFDSGGISIKPGEGMKEMKGDMSGASSVMGALLGIARLGLPINVNALAFLCENMPSGNAVKPGDVVRAMNKKTIEIDNTDAEGRLILADALCYSSSKNPKIIIDVATLTGAIVIALGHAATGVFTNSNQLWRDLEKASLKEADLMWRMPLFKDEYQKQLKSRVAQLNNIGGRPAGSGTAAVFLSEFVDLKNIQWAHLDIAGSSSNKDGYNGRPVRTLIEFAAGLASKQ